MHGAAEMKNTISIKLAGDSGDGIQLIGNQLTFVCIENGWQVQTLPDFPAEIRAPQGTLAGVSGFQLTTSDSALYVSDDQVDILVAFNPAALKSALSTLKPEGLVLYNQDQFQQKDFAKAKLSVSSIEELLAAHHTAHAVEITKQTLAVLADSELGHSDKKKAKNFYALGIVHWLLQIPLEASLKLIAHKFKGHKSVLDANQAVLRAGYNFAMTIELPHYLPQIETSQTANQGQFISGIKAVSLALAYMTVKTQLPMLVAGYPITPASNILHEAAKMKDFGIELFQAEDEIAAACAALGASFAGNLAMTCTSGPGLDLKAETLGLAVMAELPLVVIDVQRSGPSTGLPTKNEQSDLLMAVYGRHGEAPLPVIAASSPADAFYAVIDAFKLAISKMTPVILLLDAQIINATERWQVPVLEAIEFPLVDFAKSGAQPFERGADLVRPWIIPGTPGAMHRLGGLEKGDEKGAVSYDPEQHQQMTLIRQQKVSASKLDKPWLYFTAPDSCLLIISWGSTYGAVRAAVEQCKTEGYKVGLLHLRQLHPLTDELRDLFQNYQRFYVAELNQGQLVKLLRAQFLIDAKPVSQTSGQPFKVQYLKEKIREAL